MKIMFEMEQSALGCLSLLLWYYSAAAGCTSTKNAANGSEAVQTELTVLLDWYPNAVHTFLICSGRARLFRRSGLEGQAANASRYE